MCGGWGVDGWVGWWGELKTMSVLVCNSTSNDSYYCVSNLKMHMGGVVMCCENGLKIYSFSLNTTETEVYNTHC